MNLELYVVFSVYSNYDIRNILGVFLSEESAKKFIEKQNKLLGYQKVLLYD